jgi:hypothetical protein
MVIFRTIVGIIVGYVVFAASSMLLLGLTMELEGPLTIVLALAGLVVIGLVAGSLAALIAGPKARIATIIAATLVALATLANLLMGLGAEPAWYKLGTLLLTTGAILLVGLRRGGRV